MLPLLALACLAPADPPAEARRQQAVRFHLRAQERTGVLVPLYVYPAGGRDHPAFARVAELKRKYETVPFWVIVNPASGPGEKADPNYTSAVNGLRGAGCVVLGYVTTGYAKRSAAVVRADVDTWGKLYPRVHGVFFDEMTYDDTVTATDHQAGLTKYARAAGFWPAVANPGADTPARYFAADAADVIVVHEGSDWPAAGRWEKYADHPPFTRGVLIHSQPKLDPAAVRRVRQQARWVYVTEGVFRANDPAAANPWDRAAAHLGGLCEVLAEK